ncbi:MAG: hypothetical protein RLZZ631_855 [Cyanobacteriota bacterium]
MEPTQLLLPALLGSGAIGTALARRHQAHKLAHLLEARSSGVAELLDLQRSVAEQMGAGSFVERVKLSGEIVCGQPLVAPWSGEPCVAFTDTTTAMLEVREETTSTDGEGNRRTEVRWERRDQTLNHLERRCSFNLRQGNQQLPIQPEAAELELENVFSQVDPPTTDNTFNTRQLGIRREEAILRAGGMAFVVAECSDASGQLQLQAPQNGGLFVVRRGSEAEFSGAIRRWRRIWMVSTWVLSAAAVVVLATRL